MNGKKYFTFVSLHTDFVCWRGLLTRLLCTPFENRDDWRIAITKFRGTYFLCEFETESKKVQKEQITPRQDEMTYWGWKFEQYVTAGKDLRSKIYCHCSFHISIYVCNMVKIIALCIVPLWLYRNIVN